MMNELVIWGYTSVLGLMLILTFLLFVAGFFMSWKSELIAGILFIIWYFIILLLTTQFPSFANSGPWVLFGLTILFQGMFYVANNTKANQSRSQAA